MANRTPWRAAFFLAVLGLIALACNWSGAAAPAVSGSGPADLQDLQAGLDNFKNYRLSLKLRFSGKNSAGQDVTLTIDSQEERSAEIARFLFLSTGTADLPPALEMYRAGSQGYLLTPALGSNPTCQDAGSTLQTGSGLALLPQEALRGMAAAQRTGSGENINGILSDHYRLDPSNQPPAGLEQIEGDLWLAQEGGAVVRFTGSLQGPVAFSSFSGTGILGWEYNLLEVDGPTQVSLPEECILAQSAEIPLPPDAQDVLQSLTQISFTSPADPASVNDYYLQRLPETGWSLDEEAGGGQQFWLAASREGRSILITIQPMAAENGGLSRVVIETGAGGN